MSAKGGLSAEKHGVVQTAIPRRDWVEGPTEGAVPTSIVQMMREWSSAQWTTPFGRYFHMNLNSTLAGCRRDGTSRASATADESSLFPMPLPYLEEEAAEEKVLGKSFDARRRTKRVSVRRLTNRMVALANFYEAGAPHGCPPLEFQSGELNALQQAAARRLRQDAEEFCACSGGDIPVMGRGRARLNDMIQSMKSHYGPSGRVVKRCGMTTVALPVEANKVSLPDNAAHLRGADIMSPERAKVFRDLRQIELENEAMPTKRIRACHMISESEEDIFVRQLLAKGMVVLIPDSELPRHPKTGELLKGGFFGVPHREGRMRLIFDRRPQNATEADLSDEWLHLPHGSQFSEMILKPGQGCRGCCEDLQSWFHQLRHETHWWRRQAVGRRLRGEAFLEWGADAGTYYRACMCCVAMGDKNGCAYGQEAHEFILKAGGLMGIDTTLRFGEPTPFGDFWEGAYIDDRVHALKLPLERMHCVPGHASTCVHCERDGGELRDVEAVEQMLSTYDRFEATRSEGKAIRYASRFTAWGTDVDGRRGRAEVSLDKRRQIARLGFAVVKRGYASKSVLQSLVGSLIHPLMHAKPFMCCFASVYKIIDSLTHEEGARIPAAVCDEILAGVLLLASSYSDLRSQVSCEISATDATPSRAGSCVSSVPQKVANALYRRGERRGENGCLRWTEIEVLEKPTKMQRPTVELSELVKGLPWRQPIGYPLVGAHHINIQELRGVIDEVERRTLAGECGQRVVCLVDSRVVVGAIAKGRSSSPIMNQFLRRLMIRCWASNTSLKTVWVDTHSNPADCPSRDVPLPERGPLPEWAADLWSQSEGNAERCCPRRKSVVCPVRIPKMPDKEVTAQRRGNGQRVPVQSRKSKPRYCIEFYCGCGALSAQLRRRGLDACEVDAYSSGAFDSSLDLGDRKVVESFIEDVEAGDVEYCHFGLKCASWSRINMLFNGGTRTIENALGDGSLTRETDGNDQLFQMVRLIDTCNKCNVPWTLENPEGSFVWHTDELIKRVNTDDCRSVVFDQCMYHLRPPDYVKGGGDLRVNKPTRIVGTLPGLNTLACRCDRTHAHAHAYGHVRVGSKRISRAAAAGVYPSALCCRISRLVVEHLRRH